MKSDDGTRRLTKHLPLLAALVLGAWLAGWGLRWGIPSLDGWAMDELTPEKVRAGIDAHFSDGWLHRYPPLHFYLLTIVFSPLMLLEGQGIPSWDLYTWAFQAGRGLSLAMGLGTVMAIHRLTRTHFGRRAAAFAAFTVVLIPLFAYYGKIANLDVPYVFWFSLSLLFLSRALTEHRMRDYVGLAITTALAVCTKDQAYGLYVLVPVALLIARRRREPTLPVRALIFDRRVGAALATFVGLFAAIHNLVFNARGFVHHVQLILGPASTPFRQYDFSPAGLGAFVLQTEAHLRFAMGAPLYAAAIGGLVLALREKPRTPLLATSLVPALSYALFFLLPVRYQFDRFLLPVAVALAPFAGLALARLWRWSPRGGALPMGAVIVSVLLLASLRAPLAIDLALRADARYEAEAWLQAETRPGDRIALIQQRQFLPRTFAKRDWIWLTRFDATARLPTLRARWVVVNRGSLQSADPELLQRLESGWLGFVPHQRFTTDLDCGWLCDPTVLRPPWPRYASNFDKLAPEIIVFGRPR